MATALAPPIASNHCNVCLDTYRDPRVLPCKHKFCRECIEQYVVSSRDKNTLTCPTCREIVKISKEGVKDLPANMEANEPNQSTNCSNCNTPGNKAKARCVDCKEYLCDRCYGFHKGIKALKDHKIIKIEDILAGKVDMKIEEENRYCKVHGKLCEYYCETEKRVLCRDCVILNECPPQHSRVSLEKVAQKQSDELKVLKKQSDDTRKKFEEAVKATTNVKAELKIYVQLAKDSLGRVEKEYIHLVKNRVKELSHHVDDIAEERMKELDDRKVHLESIIGEFHRASEDCTRVLDSYSNFEVIATHATLSSQLEKLAKSRPETVNTSLQHVKFKVKPAGVGLPTIIGEVWQDGPREDTWKQIGQFSTGNFNTLHGLDLNQAGNVVLCSLGNGAKVFSSDGRVLRTLDESCCHGQVTQCLCFGALDVAVTSDQNYVAVPRRKSQLLTYDKTGKQINTTCISNVNDVSSNINSVAVDPNGRIIVAQELKTISIHNANGSVISKFATQSEPYKLAITSNGEIVSSFLRHGNQGESCLKLMNYSGGNVRVIQPPDKINVWYPGFVCCRAGEIFVCNEGVDYQTGVYRFTSEGDYLGCVTTVVRNPAGIALSRYGTELFVADYGDDYVKIFQRP